MATKLNMPAPKSGGGFTERFRFSKSKHNIRVFPFVHEGESTLAAINVIHFIGNVPESCSGTGCPHCAEFKATKNRDLRPTTRYPMLVVDLDNVEAGVQKLDSPASVYKAIYKILQSDNPDEILGNEGVDFIVDYDKSAQPSDMYAVNLRRKGSVVLDVEGDDLSDLIAEVTDSRERDGAVAHNEPGVTGAAVDGDKAVKFMLEGQEVVGEDTGRRNAAGKWIVEYEGRLIFVAPDDIVKDAGQEAAKEPEAPAPKKTVTTKKRRTHTLEKGDRVTFLCDNEEIGGTITSEIVTGKPVDVTTEDGDEYEVDLAELTFVMPF